MSEPLNPVEVRVLGTLIEKETTTPEYYPMTLNSLVTACNQKSNRWPVTEYDDGDVERAIETLKTRGYAASITGSGRVIKYAQRFTEKLNLGRRETAILCVLMLRGHQTLGEIKGRTDRLYGFADLDEVETVMHKMMEREEGSLATKLAAGAGMKEPRYAQLLGGPVEAVAAPGGQAMHGSGSDRIAALEAEVAQLREELSGLKRRFDELVS